MKLVKLLFTPVLPILCLLIVTCSSRNRTRLESPFYVSAASFEGCLSASSEAYQTYKREKGNAFYISDEIEASSPKFLDEAIFATDRIHFQIYHTKGFDYIFRRQVMIPSMGSRLGNPLLYSEKKEINLCLFNPVLFCDHTKKVDRWNHEIVQLKEGPVRIGSGENSKQVFRGIGVSYFWRSEISYDIDSKIDRFSCWAAPLEGSARFTVINEDMHLFLSQLKAEFPTEYENWIGPDGRSIQNLNMMNSDVPLARILEQQEKNSFTWALKWLEELDFEAIRLSFSDYPDDLQDSLQIKYDYLEELSKDKDRSLNQLESNHAEALKKVQIAKEHKEALLLANPVLNFKELLAIKRHKIPGNVGSMGQGPDPYGLPCNYQSLSMINRDLWDNSLISISMKNPTAHTILYTPKGNRYVGKMDLHFDADKILLSQPDENFSWQIYELNLLSQKIIQLSNEDARDVDNYDGCYLPSGEIIFASTACFHGVPCVNGNSDVANLCRMNADGSAMRMLCFDQDDNWHPSVLNNGKVLYTRWEYTDSPHFFTRLLMSMNPDGTNQRSYYGSNSYWPNSIYYARSVPEKTGKVVGIVSGHHGTRRAGELYLFDPAQGRHEADGVVQQIPGRNKEVEPKILDRLVDGVWPKFLNPWPLSDKYFLVAGQMSPFENWSIYLVDVYDNITLISSDPHYHLFEPIPLLARTTPPVIPDRINIESTEASVYVQDVYFGPGLKDIPKGKVKSLRLFEWHYAYRGTGGHTHVGIDGPWEPHRILGTVPVYADGSAHFTIPANTPIAIQPLDEDGKALQIMRSWFTAMPGEHLSCVGCHEDANQVPPARPTIASRKAPNKIQEWKGPVRGFSFKREIQPVLDRFCIGCHNGISTKIPDFSRKGEDVMPLRGSAYKFTPSYVALHPYVRRPGPENDYHLTNPMEYYADQTELVQLLEKGHHGVELDQDAWERIYTWIDLNVPDHGTWMEHTSKIEPLIERRNDLREKYAGLVHNPEVLTPIPPDTIKFIKPVPPGIADKEIATADGWPFDHDIAVEKQKSSDELVRLKIDIEEDLHMDFVRIPNGKFVQGRNTGLLDEYPEHVEEIENPFYMAVFETTLAQFLAFQPDHEQGVINYTNKDQSVRGFPLDNPRIPAIRISWEEAMKFCAWLSQKTGYSVSLPSEAEWEWACRAGTSTSMNYGSEEDSFADKANLADAQLEHWARRESPQWQPRIDEVDDKSMLFSQVGSYLPNPWGLYDMHGNASEWTSSAFEPYPGNSQMIYADSAKRVVRGGSWYDRPYRANSDYRLGFEQYQKVYNVGFRVILRKK